MKSTRKAILRSYAKISFISIGIIMVLHLWSWHDYVKCQQPGDACAVVEKRTNGDLIVSCNNIEYRAVTVENYRNWLLLRESSATINEHNKILLEQVDLLTQENLKLDNSNKINAKLIQDLTQRLNERRGLVRWLLRLVF